VRVLLISNIFPPGFLGGYELGALDVARGLQRHGHEVQVLTSDYFADDAHEFPVPAERVLQCTEPSRGLVSARSNLERGLGVNGHNLSMLAQSILRFRPDRVLCFNLMGLGTLGILRYLVSAGLPPVVYLMDDLFFAMRHAPAERQRVLRTWGDLSFLDAADYVVMSGNLAKQVEASLEITLTRKFLVPGWFNAGQGSSAPPWSEPKPPHDGVRFVFASRIAPHKGIDFVLQGARELLAQGLSNFTVDVFGSGNVAQLLQAITAYGVGGHVCYQGCPEKEELAQRLREYDALLFPTHEREPFGFIVSEAAWARCLPVMTAGIGASEWFLDGVDSLKIPPTVPGVTAAMQRLLSMSPAERDCLQRRAQRTAQAHLQFECAMNTIDKVITSRSYESAVPARALRDTELALGVVADVWRRANCV
jgi:glycogen(starch) synthase